MAAPCGSGTVWIHDVTLAMSVATSRARRDNPAGLFWVWVGWGLLPFATSRAYIMPTVGFDRAAVTVSSQNTPRYFVLWRTWLGVQANGGIFGFIMIVFCSKNETSAQIMAEGVRAAPEIERAPTACARRKS